MASTRKKVKIKIHCSLCKAESLLTAGKTLSLKEAREVIASIMEVIKRHERHPTSLDFKVFENSEDDPNLTRYIYSALNGKIKKT